MMSEVIQAKDIPDTKAQQTGAEATSESVPSARLPWRLMRDVSNIDYA